MRKLRRRMVGVLVGLILGWYCAGLVGDILPGTLGMTTTAHAAEAGAHDAGQKAAALLRPTESQIPFFRPVVNTIIALFVLAVVIGLLCRSLGLKDPNTLED